MRGNGGRVDHVPIVQVLCPDEGDYEPLRYEKKWVVSRCMVWCRCWKLQFDFIKMDKRQNVA